MANIFRNVSISHETVSLKENVDVEQTLQPVTIDQQDSEQARSEGYAQGFSEGVTQERNRIIEKEKQLDSLLQNIPLAMNTNRLSLTTEIADIVLLITQQLFINQQRSKESLIHQITQIISQLNEKHVIDISLHPDDITLLQHLDLKHGEHIRILADESLRLGGCVIRSKHGVFDAGIERQIDNLKRVLLQIKQGAACE